MFMAMGSEVKMNEFFSSFLEQGQKVNLVKRSCHIQEYQSHKKEPADGHKEIRKTAPQ